MVLQKLREVQMKENINGKENPNRSGELARPSKEKVESGKRNGSDRNDS